MITAYLYYHPESNELLLLERNIKDVHVAVCWDSILCEYFTKNIYSHADFHRSLSADNWIQIDNDVYNNRPKFFHAQTAIIFSTRSLFGL